MAAEMVAIFFLIKQISSKSYHHPKSKNLMWAQAHRRLRHAPKTSTSKVRARQPEYAGDVLIAGRLLASSALKISHGCKSLYWFSDDIR